MPDAVEGFLYDNYITQLHTKKNHCVELQRSIILAFSTSRRIILTDNICFPFGWYSNLLLCAGWGSIHATGPSLQEHFSVDTHHLVTVYCLFFSRSVMTSLHKQEWQETPKRNLIPSLDSFVTWSQLRSLEVPALFLPSVPTSKMGQLFRVMVVQNK